MYAVSGLISRGLCPYAKSILGVDISQGMVDQFNSKASREGIPSRRMSAVRGELKGVGGELGGQKFDVIVVSLVLEYWIGGTH